MTTSRRLRSATRCAADCGRLDAKPKEESPQQQPAKTIPAVVRDTLFMNSLRVGMFKCQIFAGFDFRLAFPDGPTYTPDPVPRKRPSCFRFEFRRIVHVECRGKGVSG